MSFSIFPDDLVEKNISTNLSAADIVAVNAQIGSTEAARAVIMNIHHGYEAGSAAAPPAELVELYRSHDY